MAVNIRFNGNVPEDPTFILMTRGGSRLGIIPAEQIDAKFYMNAADELSFQVTRSKGVNDASTQIWEQLVDFKLMWCKEWDKTFELHVETSDSEGLVKYVTGTSLGESELSQVNLYNIEINTGTDIEREDYDEDNPTIFYDPDDTSRSLLHRITEKVPHYSIGTVDDSLKDVQRMYTFDGVTLYDAFQTIADEMECIFEIVCTPDGELGIKRVINVTAIENYGQDTSIFVSVDNLSDEIRYIPDSDSVKNCFKLEAGDDVMTSAIRAVNPNGTDYIWCFSSEMQSDMSSQLQEKLKSYSEKYDEYQSTYQLDTTSVCSSYNALVSKYQSYYQTLHDEEELPELDNPIVGYPNINTALYNAIDFYNFLNSELMPSPKLSDTSAKEEAAKITASSLGDIAVENLSTASETTVTSAVEGMAGVIIDARYQVDANCTSYNTTSHVWTGSFTVTNYSDEDDTADTSTMSVTISEDTEIYLKNKIDKALARTVTDDPVGVVALFKKADDEFKSELKKYCLASLNGFQSCCESCLSILISAGVADDETSDVYTSMYKPYLNKRTYIDDEVAIRESELIVIGDPSADTSTGTYAFITKAITQIHSDLDFEEYLGSTLWTELISFRREDTYSNSNYISDGLSNTELINRSNEFIDTAKEELEKSANLQHSIEATLYNLLVMPEFSPIVNYFENGNWITVRIGDDKFKLRLIEYEINWDNLSDINVTFSDVTKSNNSISDTQSILLQAQGMSTSYNSTERQAKRATENKKQLDTWVNDGLSLTNTKIVNTAYNQDITYDEHGILARQYDDIYKKYDDRQLKIINKGLYVTNDNWVTAKAGIGEFTFWDPSSQTYKDAYGVIADTIVGNIILGKSVGIYNVEGSTVINEEGITITSDQTGESEIPQKLTLKTKYIDATGTVQTKDIFYIDSDGNLRIDSITIDDVSKEFDEALDEAKAELAKQIDSKIETFYQSDDPSKEWEDNATKAKHVGDFWCYTGTTNDSYTNMCSYVYTNNGTSTNPNYVWVEKSVPKELFDTIDKKKAIYYGTTTQYLDVAEEGDYLVDYSTGSTYRLDATQTPHKWVEVSNYRSYTDGVTDAIKKDLEGQIDKKIETFIQDSDPSLNTDGTTKWTDAEKAEHVGDLWCYTGETTEDKTRIQNATYRYTYDEDSKNYSWVAYSASKELFDEIDGKKTIYYGTLGDEEIKGKANKGDFLVISTEGDTKGNMYTWDGSIWIKTTDLQGIRSGILGIENQLDQKINTYYQSTDPSLDDEGKEKWTDTEKAEHVGDLWCYTGESTEGSYQNNSVYEYTVNAGGTGYSWVLSSANTDLFDKIDGKAVIYYGDPTDTETWKTKANEGDYLIDSRNGTDNNKYGDMYQWTKVDDSYQWVKVSDPSTAATTATNYLDFTAENGLIIRRSKDDTSNYVQINSSEVNVATGGNIVATFGESATIGSRLTGATVGTSSFVVGEGCVASNKNQTVLGHYNYLDSDSTAPNSILTIGNGTNNNNRSDVLRVDDNGDVKIKGTLIVGFQDDMGSGTTLDKKISDSTDSVKTTLESELDTLKDDLEAQIDGKIETFYQSVDPSRDDEGEEIWSDTEKAQHVGDLWCYTGDTTDTLTNMAAYKYTCTVDSEGNKTYSWESYANAPKELFDKIDKKKNIYYKKFSEAKQITDADDGDYLVDPDTGSTYKYVESTNEWEQVSSYKTYVDDIKESLENQIDTKIETFYQDSDPSLDDEGKEKWTDDEKKEHIGDLWCYTGTSTTSIKQYATFRYTESTSESGSSTYSWEAYSATKELFDEIDGKKTIYYTNPEEPEFPSGTTLSEGDYIVDNRDGYYGDMYRYTKNGDTYEWVQVSDVSGAATKATQYIKVTTDKNGIMLTPDTTDTDSYYYTSIKNDGMHIYDNSDNAVASFNNSSMKIGLTTVAIGDYSSSIGGIISKTVDYEDENEPRKQGYSPVTYTPKFEAAGSYSDDFELTTPSYGPIYFRSINNVSQSTYYSIAHNNYIEYEKFENSDYIYLIDANEKVHIFKISSFEYKETLPDTYGYPIISITLDESGDPFPVGLASLTNLIYPMPGALNKGAINFGPNYVTGKYAFSNGYVCESSGNYAYSEGYYNSAYGSSSHVEGAYCKANGNYSHAEGHTTTALGKYSHASGLFTIAKEDYQTAIGCYNVQASETVNHYILTIGNGDSSSRSNALAITRQGKIILSDKGYAYGTSAPGSAIKYPEAGEIYFQITS